MYIPKHVYRYTQMHVYIYACMHVYTSRNREKETWRLVVRNGMSDVMDRMNGERREKVRKIEKEK